MLYCVGVCVGVRERERQSFFLHFIYLFLAGLGLRCRVIFSPAGARCGALAGARCSAPAGARCGAPAGLVAVLPLGLVAVLPLGLVAVLRLGLIAVLRLGLVAVLGLLITVASLAVERARQPRCVNVRGLDACSL